MQVKAISLPVKSHLSCEEDVRKKYIKNIESEEKEKRENQSKEMTMNMGLGRLSHF